MFKLLKLSLYALIGYALYEFIRGMTRERQTGSRGAARGTGLGSGRIDTLSSEPRNPLTGPGVGYRVQTGEDAGTSVSHRVGRGVVR